MRTRTRIAKVLLFVTTPCEEWVEHARRRVYTGVDGSSFVVLRSHRGHDVRVPVRRSNGHLFARLGVPR